MAIRLRPLLDNCCARPADPLRWSVTNPNCWPFSHGFDGVAVLALPAPSFMPGLLLVPLQAAQATFAPGICSSHVAVMFNSCQIQNPAYFCASLSVPRKHGTGPRMQDALLANSEHVEHACISFSSRRLQIHALCCCG